MSDTEFTDLAQFRLQDILSTHEETYTEWEHYGCGCGWTLEGANPVGDWTTIAQAFHQHQAEKIAEYIQSVLYAVGEIGEAYTGYRARKALEDFGDRFLRSVQGGGDDDGPGDKGDV